MAKPKKKTNLFNTPPATDEETPKTLAAEPQPEIVLERSNAIMPELRTEKDLDLEEQIKKLEADNAELATQNGELQDKLAVYIEEAEKLRAEVKAPTVSADTDLTIKLGEFEKEILDLKAENKILQETNDNYMTRVSELTFENASLHAQIQSLNQTDESKPAQPIRQHPMSNQVPYKNPYANNGYGDWN